MNYNKSTLSHKSSQVHAVRLSAIVHKVDCLLNTIITFCINFIIFILPIYKDFLRIPDCNSDYA